MRTSTLFMTKLELRTIYQNSIKAKTDHVMLFNSEQRNQSKQIMYINNETHRMNALGVLRPPVVHLLDVGRRAAVEERLLGLDAHHPGQAHGRRPRGQLGQAQHPAFDALRRQGQGARDERLRTIHRRRRNPRLNFLIYRTPPRRAVGIFTQSDTHTNFG